MFEEEVGTRWFSSEPKIQIFAVCAKLGKSLDLLQSQFSVYKIW